MADAPSAPATAPRRAAWALETSSRVVVAPHACSSPSLHLWVCTCAHRSGGDRSKKCALSGLQPPRCLLLPQLLPQRLDHHFDGLDSSAPRRPVPAAGAAGAGRLLWHRADGLPGVPEPDLVPVRFPGGAVGWVRTLRAAILRGRHPRQPAGDATQNGGSPFQSRNEPEAEARRRSRSYPSPPTSSSSPAAQAGAITNAVRLAAEHKRPRHVPISSKAGRAEVRTEFTARPKARRVADRRPTPPGFPLSWARPTVAPHVLLAECSPTAVVQSPRARHFFAIMQVCQTPSRSCFSFSSLSPLSP